MVKSNKFDYTGRTSSGPKLGRSIAADLEKRADRKQRDSLKASAKQTFKSHFPASRSRKGKEPPEEHDLDKEDKEDAKQELHKLDLRVPGKALGDEGFALLCDGLQNAMSSCVDLALVDFNASNNSLTASSLARLASVIHQSRFNLQSLDLSNNNFQVTNAAEAQAWERFLCAFHDCMTLRRVDLSDNPRLGQWAMEIFARIYSREPLVDPLPATGAQSMITLSEDDSLSCDEAESHPDTRTHDDVDELPRCANGKTLADTWELGYRRGLRSLPYLTLANVGLTDTGALFLSSVIEQHYYPIQLITEVNAVEANNQFRTYRQDTNSKGIDWEDNSDTLGKEGFHLLQCAEKQRAKMILGDVDSFTSSAYDIIRHSEVHDGNVAKKFPHASRRASLRSIHSAEHSIYDKSDIGSAKKKIQRTTIIQTGCRSVELWQSALQAIAFSRTIYTIAPEPRSPPTISDPSTGETSLDRSISRRGSENDMRDSHASIASYDEFRDSLYGHTSKQSLAPIEEIQPGKRTYAATLMETVPQNSNEAILAITDAAESPVVPAVQSAVRFASPSPKGCEAIRRDSHALDSNAVHLDGATVLDDGSNPYIEYQKEHMQSLQIRHYGQSDGYRDSSLRCQLPLPVCVQILANAMDPHDFGILKPQQQRTAFAWGQKKETLRTELEWRRKDESSQLLMLLSGAGCVDY